MISIEKKSLHEITTKLVKLLGDDLKVVVAFGSKIRGNSVQDSDFDILVVIKQRTFSVIDTINALFLQEEKNTGIPFSVVIKSQDTFLKEKTFNTPFYRNIKNEGLLLYGTA
jgi:uncharacterized protein